MKRWAPFLVVLLAVMALSADVGAQGFGPTYGGGASSSQSGSGQFGTAPSQLPPSSPGAYASPGLLSSAGYAIGPQDVLEISVFGVPELSGTLIVADNGTIQLPLLGETPAAGKTARELQGELAARLGEQYLQNPQVLVVVKEYNSRTVILTGEIKSPGVYPLKGQTTLLQLVASAGGVGEGSDFTVLILRKSGGRQAAAKFDVSQIEKGKAQDPVLQAGDTVVAGSSMIKKAYKGFLKALPIAGAFAIF